MKEKERKEGERDKVLYSYRRNDVFWARSNQRN